MTTLEKITLLLESKELNRKQFAELSGIPYTTVMNWYTRGANSMTLSSFKRICDYFHVTMDSMARDYMDIEYYDPASKDFYTNENERALLIAFRKADIIDQTSIRRTLHLNDTDQKKSASVS